MEIKLADNIKRFRKEQSFTQEQLAEILGVTVGAVYKWEAGLSMPEIRLIMALADIFEVSVDVLLGYEMQSSNVDSSIKIIEAAVRDRNFTNGMAEAEKALQKYPNHFGLVYTCGFFYQLKFMEQKELTDIERSNALFERAIRLLYQNTDNSINEVSILNLIAQNYMLAEKTEEALESFKKNNVCGINNSLIGMLYARMLKQPDNAKEYLMKAFSDGFGNIIRTMAGHVYMYESKKDYIRSMEALEWLYAFIESVRKEDAKNTFLDTLKAAILTQSAVTQTRLGNAEQAKNLIHSAHKLAKQFDAEPVYSLTGIRFFEDAPEEAMAYVDIGSTVREAVENILDENEEDDASRYVHGLWEELINDK